MRVRRIPLEVEAVKFDPIGVHKMKLPDGVEGINSPNADNWAYEGCKFFINTLEGRLNVSPGDWIVKGVNGEYNPVKPDIFEKIYEILDHPDNDKRKGCPFCETPHYGHYHCGTCGFQGQPTDHQCNDEPPPADLTREQVREINKTLKKYEDGMRNILKEPENKNER